MQTVVNGVLTNYLDINSSNKKCFLILHGWGHSVAHWQKVIVEIAKETRVVALDMPSFGNSSPLPGEPSVKEYSDFIVAFIQKLKLKEVVLLGHSFGGQVAVDIAIRHPKSIKRLVLVSPACVRNQTPTLRSKIAILLKPVFNSLPEDLSGYVKRFTASSDYLKSNKIQREIFNRIIYVDYSSSLNKITHKTYIIWGTEDKLIPNSSKFVAEQIKDSKLIPLYGADHNPHLFAVDKLVRAIMICLD